MTEVQATPKKMWELQAWDYDCQCWESLDDENYPPTAQRYEAEDDLRDARRKYGGKLRVAECK